MASVATIQPPARLPGREPQSRLILHADDLGMNAAVNRGILAGFRDGLLTSASVLANGPAFESALAGWAELTTAEPLARLPSSAARRGLHDGLFPFDLGVHLNLTQGRPLTGDRYPAELLDRQGRFPGVFALCRRLLGGGGRIRPMVRDELSAQIERVLDHGVTPTHLNGHQYAEMLPVVATIIPELLTRYAIPVVRVAWERSLTRTTLLAQGRAAAWGVALVKRIFALGPRVRLRQSRVSFPDAYFGTAHAGRVDLATLGRFLDAAPSGTVEIGLHPGDEPSPISERDAGDGWHDPLAALRPRELSFVTSAVLAEALAARGARLGRLSALARAAPRPAAA